MTSIDKETIIKQSQIQIFQIQMTQMIRQELLKPQIADQKRNKYKHQPRLKKLGEQSSL